MIACAEYKAKTVLEYNPDAEIIKNFDKLVDDIIKLKKSSKKYPIPMSDDEFDEFFKTFEIKPN
jgi:nitrogenase subunit NifH